VLAWIKICLRAKYCIFAIYNNVSNLRERIILCGIVGYYGIKTIPERQLNNCLDLMHRRGPDNAAYHSSKKANRNLYLLHTRLSIIDLDERAHQPFHFNGKTLILNGEIYNYLEIKQQLESKGYHFNTTSDTEVVIKAFDCFGIEEALDAMEGMWAFALYDEHQQRLDLSRDRFGEKPLYLYRDETGLYFGSEVKFIAALLGRKLEINYNHLYRYLVNGYKALYKTEETFFKGIVELNPGTLLSIEDRKSVV